MKVTAKFVIFFLLGIGLSFFGFSSQVFAFDGMLLNPTIKQEVRLVVIAHKALTCELNPTTKPDQKKIYDGYVVATVHIYNHTNGKETITILNVECLPKNGVIKGIEKHINYFDFDPLDMYKIINVASPAPTEQMRNN